MGAETILVMVNNPLLHTAPLLESAVWSRLLAGSPRWPLDLPRLTRRARSAEACTREFPHVKPLEVSGHRGLLILPNQEVHLHISMLHRHQRAEYGLLPHQQQKKDPIRDWLRLKLVARKLFVDRYQTLSNGEADQPG